MLYDPNIKTGNRNEKFTGFCKDLLDRLATDLQFQYDLYLAPDKQYGKMKDNTSWTGMVGELIKKVCTLCHRMVRGYNKEECLTFLLRRRKLGSV